MSTVVRCDGCRNEFGYRFEQEPAITGHRSNGFGGGGLPNDDFHWCHSCAVIAFREVRRERERVTQAEAAGQATAGGS